MTTFWGKTSYLVDEENMTKGRLGNWIAVKLSNNTKTVIIINVYRLPVLSSKGVYCCLTQYNKIDGKTKLTKEYRNETF